MKKIKKWLTVLLVFYTLTLTTALRASQLFLQAKTSTTSSTTESLLKDDTEEIETTDILNNTSTKPTLTGIPQIDYIWDPNLPHELHGYNLTDYPFFNAVPPAEEIDFKCDGLHDGFYASVKHKCQLYHHCLFGIRYDFLCANFTAFDQKTFICHFVSEVDCKNSPKYYHRNDALYMAATTTTLAPVTTTTTTTTSTTTTPAPQRRQNRPHNRRPLRRQRPQYEDDDYYDDYDYYEDRYRRRKQRPRHRRPDYDDEYEDRRSFSDERHDRRFNRNRKEEYEDEQMSYGGRRKYEPKLRNRNRNSNPKFGDNDNKEKSKPNERRGNRYIGNNPKIIDDDNNDEAAQKDRNQFDDDRRKFGNNEKRYSQRDRRPSNRDEIKSEPSSEEVEDRSEPSVLVRPSVSSSSSLSSLFDRPRAAPRIARPVPSNEKRKYAYNATTSTTTSTEKPSSEDDYYDEDDYDQETEHKNITRDVVSMQPNNKNVEIKEPDYEEDEDLLPISEKHNTKSTNTQPIYRDNFREEQRDSKPNVRVIKRPFLPSRGGSPYLPRGLQPVGSFQNESSTESTPIDMGSTISGVRLLEHGQPILRSQLKESLFNGPRTTLLPKSVPKLNIEDLYETEYDVTLNDALNPTLKPLSSDLRRKATFPQTHGFSSQTRNQESPRHLHKYYDY